MLSSGRYSNGMRGYVSHPAVQLGSVAERYRRIAGGPVRRADLGGGQSLAAAAFRPGRRRRERDERLARVEALLFVAREPVPVRRLSTYANLADATEARTLVRKLNEIYDRRGCAFRVEEVAGGFQLLTRSKFAAWLRRLGHVPGDARLSAPALETLAVVAYRQPVLRANIEAIRGVNCGEILRQLLERDLICISGRSDELGRPYVYSTTQKFLQVFGLRSLDDLPRAEIFRDTSTAAAVLPMNVPAPDQNSHIDSID